MSHPIASNIVLANSGKSSRPKIQPTSANAADPRVWRIGLIQSAWRRVVARLSGENTQ